MNEAKQTTNPVRLIMLGWEIKDSLDEALRLAPDDVDVRLDLVRYHVTTPRIVGGSMDEAREQAAQIAARDTALGHFARGYIAYREKEYGPARRELQEAAKLATLAKTKTLALTWLGWLSQETQQYDAAFDAWTQLDMPYELGRTAAFCSCRLELGEAALKRYIASPRTADMPSLAEAKYFLGLVYEKRGNVAAARREIETAWRLDPKIAGVKEARKRLR
jgi:tetratricopeptide (TPR) repeat protein